MGFLLQSMGWRFKKKIVRVQVCKAFEKKMIYKLAYTHVKQEDMQKLCILSVTTREITLKKPRQKDVA